VLCRPAEGGWAVIFFLQRNRYIEAAYDQCSRACALQKKKLIARETWRGWHNWLAEIARHPVFEKVHKDNFGLFDADFQNYVGRLLADIKAGA